MKHCFPWAWCRRPSLIEKDWLFQGDLSAHLSALGEATLFLMGLVQTPFPGRKELVVSRVIFLPTCLPRGSRFQPGQRRTKRLAGPSSQTLMPEIPQKQDLSENRKSYNT